MPIPLIERIQRDVPVGVVRRRLRPHRDGLGRHLPRPRQHRHQARQRRPAVPVPRARHLGRARRVGARRASAARSSCAARRCSRATGAIPTRPSTAFAGGWFHTGDIGVRDDDGYLYIVDRLKDMIVSGGENIASSEVERVLYEHEAVRRGRGRRPPRRALGRGAGRATSCCAPDATATADELIEHCRGQLAQVQGPEGRRVRRRAPAQPVGQGPQARAARPARLTVESGRWASEGGRPVHEVGGDGVAGLVVDRPPSARRRPRSSARRVGVDVALGRRR